MISGKMKKMRLSDLIDEYKHKLSNPRVTAGQNPNQMVDEATLALALTSAGRDMDAGKFYKLCGNQRGRLQTKTGRESICLDLGITMDCLDKATAITEKFLIENQKYIKEIERASIDKINQRQAKRRQAIYG